MVKTGEIYTIKSNILQFWLSTELPKYKSNYLITFKVFGNYRILWQIFKLSIQRFFQT